MNFKNMFFLFVLAATVAGFLFGFNGAEGIVKVTLATGGNYAAAKGIQIAWGCAFGGIALLSATFIGYNLGYVFNKKQSSLI